MANKDAWEEQMRMNKIMREREEVLRKEKQDPWNIEDKSRVHEERKMASMGNRNMKDLLDQ